LEPGEQRRGAVRLTGNHHPRVRLDDAAQPLPDDRVVVRDEDANLRVRSAHGCATGIVTAIPVPCPGSPRIIRVPPHANARSRMPTNPRDRSPLSDWGVNPTPLSSTPRMITPPTRVDVSVRRVGGVIILGVEDNGVGFTPQSLSGLRSLGLVGIRERALACGGTLMIRGEPGQGTGIAVTIPVA